MAIFVFRDMIDKITITVNDSGHFIVNAGDVLLIETPYWQECVLHVKDNVRKLGYFPDDIGFGVTPAVSWDELNSVALNAKHEKEKRKAKRELKA